VQVNTLSDIQAVVAQFGPNSDLKPQSIPIQTLLEESEDGNRVLYRVSSETKSKSRRSILIEGLDLIKKRLESPDDEVESLEINGKLMKPATMKKSADGLTWVDPLIKQWTGGTRKNTLITWDIKDGYEYRYEIYTHSLTRIKRPEG
jgi:hypothetical protein